MKNVQENISILNDLLKQVKDHCMCYRLVDEGSHFMVYYNPYETFCVDGVRVSYRYQSKASALRKLLEVMEDHWKSSFP